MKRCIWVDDDGQDVRGQLDFYFFKQLSKQLNSTEILKDRQMTVLQVPQLKSDKKFKNSLLIFSSKWRVENLIIGSKNVSIYNWLNTVIPLQSQDSYIWKWKNFDKANWIFFQQKAYDLKHNDFQL